MSTPQWFAEFERDEARRQDRLDQIRADMKERDTLALRPTLSAAQQHQEITLSYAHRRTDKITIEDIRHMVALLRRTADTLERENL